MKTKTVIKTCKKAFKTLNIKDEDVKQNAYVFALKSMSTFKNEDEAFKAIVNFIAQEINPEQEIDDVMLKDALEHLDARHQYILKSLYGVGWSEPMSVKEIAKAYNCTPNEIYILKNEALELLRSIMLS